MLCPTLKLLTYFIEFSVKFELADRVSQQQGLLSDISAITSPQHSAATIINICTGISREGSGEGSEVERKVRVEK